MNPHGLSAAAQVSPIRLNAAGAQDAAGGCWAPVSLLVDARREGSRRASGVRPRLLAIGTPAEVDGDARSRGAQVVEMPRTVVLPGLVNAHTHLDLTHIGPREHEAASGFMPWVEMIRQGRAKTEDAVRAAVERGIELSRSAGVVAVGDIAGAARSSGARASLVPWRTMRERGMAGVSFLEFFAIGTARERFAQWLPALVEQAAADEDALAEDGDPGWRARIGLQPHAPNTVCLSAYRWACAEAATRGLGLATHLAESPEERRFVARAEGPMRVLLEGLGLWDETIGAEAGGGLSPAGYLVPTLAGSGALLAHVNDASDADIELLARSGCTVAYCPRASEYFGAAEHFGPHRYREMLEVGINVALGTDSLVNLPPAAARTPEEGGRGMSIIDEMRRLRGRDGTDGRTLLAMGTVNGARALGLAEESFVFRPGTLLGGLVGVDVGEATSGGGEPVELALASDSAAKLLFG